MTFRSSPLRGLIENLKSNIQEVRVRGGELYVIADAGTEMVEGEGVRILNMPENYACCHGCCTSCRCSCSPATPHW